MATSTKQQTTYKKRVISESDDEGSSSGAEDDVPLLARSNASEAAAPVVGAPEMAKTASNEGKHIPQDVTSGSVILKEAAGSSTTSQPPTHVEDAHLRHEIAASGFPVDVAAASSSTGAHAHPASATNGQAVATDSKMDDNDSSDDDKPLAAKVTENGTVPTTNGHATTAEKPASKISKKAKDDTSSSDDGKPLSLNLDKKKPKKPVSKPKSSERKRKVAPVKEEESSDDDVPLSKQTNGNSKEEDGHDANEMDVDESSEDDTPLASKAKPASKGKQKAKSKSKRAKDEDSDFAEDEDKPKKKKQRNNKSETPAEPTSKPKAKGKAAPKVKKEDLASPVKKLQAKVKEEDNDSQGAGGSQRDDDEEDDEYKWWKAKMEEEAEDGDDDGPKWTTLQHSGVLFPPEYEPLPSNIKLKYDGKPLDLPPEAEEVAGFFAALLETEHAADPVFRENFFRDFLGVLAEFPPRNKVKIDPVNGMDRLDFSEMHQYFEVEKEKKKGMTKEEKKKAKEERDALEKPYKTCLIDGREEIVGNFRLEPPGLFRGRGQHPKKGKLKKRIKASQITINIGKDAVVPKAPPGQEWGAVVHKQDVTWLANWQENVNNNFKYVFLAAGSTWKGQSDFKKYEKARELKKCIGRIRLDYEKDLTSKVMADRQRATAVYFIDRFALRVGNEKGEDEADTVGCCSLRYEHITLAEPNLVTFDFLGKDSIRFYQPDKEVDLQVFKNLKLFKKGGKEGDAIFDRVKPDILNKFFGNYMKGLSAKVFRTYNASFLLQQQLLNTPTDVSIADKLLHYNRANRLVSEMCNHQRAVSKTHGQAMEKLSDKVRHLKYQRMKLRYTLFTIDPDNKKKHKQYKDMESDLEDDWMEKHEEELVEKEKVKIRKKWEKDNEKRKADGEKPLSEKELNDMLKAADEFGKEISTERKKKHVEPKKAQTTAKVLEAIAKIDERIDAQKIQALDREEGKEISLTTARINYMDPRVTVAWCKKHDVPLEKLYSKTLRTKFVWAMEVDENWEF